MKKHLEKIKRSLIDNLNEERENRGLCPLYWELMSHEIAMEYA